MPRLIKGSGSCVLHAHAERSEVDDDAAVHPCHVTAPIAEAAALRTTQ